MHNMDAKKMYREKVRWELYKNPTSYLEKILEATPYKTTAVWPLTTHLKNHPSKTNKTYGTQQEKQGRTHKWRSSMDASVLADQQELFPVNFYPLTHQILAKIKNQIRLFFGEYK